jgi:cytochrome c peroxidase
MPDLIPNGKPGTSGIAFRLFSGACFALALGLLVFTSGRSEAALDPPKPYVPGTDALGVPTKLTLEEAGILKPDGRPWAILLGKALFWDQQVGSDGQSCASCHYHAGADTRKVNTFSPGFLKQPTEDTKFGTVTSFDGEPLAYSVAPGATQGSNGFLIDSSYEVKPEDFPIYKLQDYLNRNSKILYATDDAVGSQGSFDAAFGRVKRLFSIGDKCSEAEGDIFHAGKFAARQVAPRNTPTTVNSVFSFSNFWDGRANNQFNGVGVFGPRDIAGDPKKRLIVLDAAGKPSLGFLQVKNASLASQAVGPALSEKEMSCDGRTFADVGRKMLLRRPLALQKVHAQDSVFGLPNAVGNLDLRHVSGRGLKDPYRYSELIKKAFNEKYWKQAGRFVITDAGQLKQTLLQGYTQMEHNFSMFWGMSIMLYEGTLISDQSKFDTWFASCDPVATNTNGLAVPVGNPTVKCQIPNLAFNPALPVNPTTNPQKIPNPDPLLADPTNYVYGGFTAQEVLGWGMFNNAGTGIRNAGNPSCNGCHNGPAVFSEAQFTASPTQPFGTTFVPVERSRIDDRGPGTPNIPLPTLDQRAAGQLSTVEGAVHDRGFFNIGSRPTSFDVGNGGTDPYGNPLSVSRMFLKEQATKAPVVDPSGIADPCNTPGLIEGGFPSATAAPPVGAPEVNAGRYPGCLAGNAGSVLPSFDWNAEREMVDGTFKTPSIRNIGLTPPYFHFGGYSNLRQVVEFYARGGSRRDKSTSLNNASYTGDTSGNGTLGKEDFPLAGPHFGTNVDFFVRDVKSTDTQIDAMVAFMLTLTDRRVQCDAAPFDHPSLFIATQPLKQDLNNDGRADDKFFELPDAGIGGYAPASGFCIPNTGDLFAPGMQSRSGGPRVALP